VGPSTKGALPLLRRGNFWSWKSEAGATKQGGALAIAGESTGSGTSPPEALQSKLSRAPSPMARQRALGAT
jgi:hypothetical protein